MVTPASVLSLLLRGGVESDAGDGGRYGSGPNELHGVTGYREWRCVAVEFPGESTADFFYPSGRFSRIDA
jgi:hypothetical protein